MPDKPYTQYLIHSIKTNHRVLFQRCFESRVFSDRDWDNALLLSALCGRSDFVKKIIEDRSEKVDLDRGLQAAASGGNTRILMYLQRNGADPRKDNDFPFRLSLGKNRPVTTGYLVVSGASLTHTESAIREAHAKGYRDLAMDMVQLTSQAAHPNNALAWAVRNKKDYIAMASILAGACPNLNDGELLYRAIRNNQLNLVKVLLANGADLFARGEQVALSAARGSNSIEMIGYLQKQALLLRDKQVVLPPTERAFGRRVA